jgi:hypothetical protein
MQCRRGIGPALISQVGKKNTIHAQVVTVHITLFLNNKEPVTHECFLPPFITTEVLPLQFNATVNTYYL